MAIERYLTHEKLVVRFLALLGVVSIVFVAIWALSYSFLPEGLLRGRTGGQILAGNDLAGGSVWLEWLRILAINLGVTFVVMVPANLIRTRRNIPLGYFSVISVAAVCAATIGTNSFTLPMVTRMPPSLGAFTSSGVYEIAAYVLAVTATVSIARWRIARWWGPDSTETLAPSKDGSTILERNVGVAVSVMTLVAACGWEAYRISLVLAP